MAVWISLLRGVNLGARNKVAMAELREALTDDGFRNVRTYVQSGNVVSESDHDHPGKVAADVHDLIERRFDLDVPVIVRSPQQLRAIEAWCPFPQDAATRPTGVNVVHLATTPDPERVAALLAADWAPDAVQVNGPEVVVCLATTMHESRLQPATVLRRLAVQGTARNWRTLQALISLSTE